MSANETFLSAKQIKERYNIGSLTSVWRMTQAGHLPRPYKLSPGCTRWKLSEIEAWENERKSA
ncbi:MAG: AlpA family transcriptional regulator [Alcanivoracaceae bacterium]|nr:AlpA family transcriptional regulator [Alcanivoracaceae bacterium]